MLSLSVGFRCVYSIKSSDKIIAYQELICVVILQAQLARLEEQQMTMMETRFPE